MRRVSAAALRELAAALLAAAGLAARHAACYAEKILAADLLGHGSHGIRLLPRSLDELQRGNLTRDGDPEVVADHGASLLVDGGMLPGPVVVVHAVERALARVVSPRHASSSRSAGPATSPRSARISRWRRLAA